MGSLPVQAIKHIARKPAQKWDLPATTAQESGWLLSNPARAQTLSPELPSRHSKSSSALPGHRKKKSRSQKWPDEPIMPPPLGLVAPTNDHVLRKNLSTPVFS